MNRLVNGLNISLCRQPAPHRQDLFLATEAVKLMLQGRIGHHGHQVGHIHVGWLGHNLDVAQLEPQTSNCFSGQAIRLQPAAHDLVPKNLIPLLDDELGRISQLSWAPLVEAPTACNSRVGGSIVQKGVQVADNAVNEPLLVPVLQEHDDSGIQRLVHSGRVRGQLDVSDLRVRDGAMAAKVVLNQVDMMRGARLNSRHEHLFEPALEDRSVSPTEFCEKYGSGLALPSPWKHIG